MRRIRPGDVVNIAGCHIWYRPTLVRFEDDQAIVVSMGEERRWPASKVRSAEPIPAKKRSTADLEYD